MAGLIDDPHPSPLLLLRQHFAKRPNVKIGFFTTIES
jgi:hypothetical protein